MVLGSLRQVWAMGDSMPNDGEHRLTFGAREWQSRGSYPFAAQPYFLHAKLYVLHELDVHVELEERRKPAVHPPRLVPPLRSREFPEVLILARKGDAGSGYPAVDAQDRAFQNQVIDACKERIAITHGDPQFGNAARIA